MDDFQQRRALALAILTKGEGLGRRSGQFLGQIACDQSPLSEKQQHWLDCLAIKAGLAVEA